MLEDIGKALPRTLDTAAESARAAWHQTIMPPSAMSTSTRIALDADEEYPTVLILGGWSPGPLLYLKRNFHGQCTFVEPKIPMPPVGFSWCFDVGMLALVLVIAMAIWVSVALRGWVDNRALAIARVTVVIVALFLSRLCVAAVARGAIRRGVNIATRCMRERRVDVVIGFSWGGGVVAEMMRLGLVADAVLLIAPTTALMSSFAMKKDAALTIRVPDDMSHRVHVFHGTEDESFCPHSDRWELTGVSFHLVHDNHVFCRRESIHELSVVLASLMSQAGDPNALPS